YGQSIVCDPAGRYIWVGNKDQTLSWIDSFTGSEIDQDQTDADPMTRVVTGINPGSMAITPDCHYLYVTSMDSTEIAVVDIKSRELETVVSLPGNRTCDIFIEPSGFYAYVLMSAQVGANPDGGVVVQIDIRKKIKDMTGEWIDNPGYNGIVNTVELNESLCKNPKALSYDVLTNKLYIIDHNYYRGRSRVHVIENLPDMVPGQSIFPLVGTPGCNILRQELIKLDSFPCSVAIAPSIIMTLATINTPPGIYSKLIGYEGLSAMTSLLGGLSAFPGMPGAIPMLYAPWLIFMKYTYDPIELNRGWDIGTPPCYYDTGNGEKTSFGYGSFWYTGNIGVFDRNSGKFIAGTRNMLDAEYMSRPYIRNRNMAVSVLGDVVAVDPLKERVVVYGHEFFENNLLHGDPSYWHMHELAGVPGIIIVTGGPNDVAIRPSLYLTNPQDSIIIFDKQEKKKEFNLSIFGNRMIDWLKGIKITTKTMGNQEYTLYDSTLNNAGIDWYPLGNRHGELFLKNEFLPPSVDLSEIKSLMIHVASAESPYALIAAQQGTEPKTPEFTCTFKILEYSNNNEEGSEKAVITLGGKEKTPLQVFHPRPFVKIDEVIIPPPPPFDPEHPPINPEQRMFSREIEINGKITTWLAPPLPEDCYFSVMYNYKNVEITSNKLTLSNIRDGEPGSQDAVKPVICDFSCKVPIETDIVGPKDHLITIHVKSCFNEAGSDSVWIYARTGDLGINKGPEDCGYVPAVKKDAAGNETPGQVLYHGDSIPHTDFVDISRYAFKFKVEISGSKDEVSKLQDFVTVDGNNLKYLDLSLPVQPIVRDRDEIISANGKDTKHFITKTNLFFLDYNYFFLKGNDVYRNHIENYISDKNIQVIYVNAEPESNDELVGFHIIDLPQCKKKEEKNKYIVTYHIESFTLNDCNKNGCIDEIYGDEPEPVFIRNEFTYKEENDSNGLLVSKLTIPVKMKVSTTDQRFQDYIKDHFSVLLENGDMGQDVTFEWQSGEKTYNALFSREGDDMWSQKGTYINMPVNNSFFGRKQVKYEICVGPGKPLYSNYDYFEVFFNPDLSNHPDDGKEDCAEITKAGGGKSNFKKLGFNDLDNNGNNVRSPNWFYYYRKGDGSTSIVEHLNDGNCFCLFSKDWKGGLFISNMSISNGKYGGNRYDGYFCLKNTAYSGNNHSGIVHHKSTNDSYLIRSENAFLENVASIVSHEMWHREVSLHYRKYLYDNGNYNMGHINYLRLDLDKDVIPDDPVELLWNCDKFEPDTYNIVELVLSRISHTTFEDLLKRIKETSEKDFVKQTCYKSYYIINPWLARKEKNQLVEIYTKIGYNGDTNEIGSDTFDTTIKPLLTPSDAEFLLNRCYDSFYILNSGLTRADKTKLYGIFNKIGYDLEEEYSKIGDQELQCRYREGRCPVRYYPQFDWAQDGKNYRIVSIESEECKCFLP
ncbi:MAG: hypothetical protein JXB88_08840, partial [Spirochaetales bacterium]|nr:hypothetical protein [Spirochaetales bacterium]